MPATVDHVELRGIEILIHTWCGTRSVYELQVCRSRASTSFCSLVVAILVVVTVIMHATMSDNISSI